MESLSQLFEQELIVLKRLASEDPLSFEGNWVGMSLDYFGSFCSRSAPGSPLRRLVDLGLVVEYRREYRRYYDWQWEITRNGRKLLASLEEGSEL